MSMQFKAAPLEIKDVTATGTFCGYGNVYDVVDQGDDIVASGAFADSLKEWAAKDRMPAMLWQHNSRQPIGAYTAMKEDGTGLYVEGKLAMKTQLGAESYELMKMGAISGLSIGFQTREDSYDQKLGIRTIKKGDLYECSLVTFPMNDESRISAVKTIEEIGDLSGAEHYLREVGGVSRSEAKALVSRIHALARREAAPADGQSADLKAITELLNRRKALFAA
jgi:HK97 family phage prohead protease